MTPYGNNQVGAAEPSRGILARFSHGRLGRRLGLPARADTLLRWRETDSQAQLARVDRVANVAGAFMPDPQGGLHLRGRDIALVDDVMTTGATAHAAALAALEAGARSVSLWVAARTPADAGSA